MSFLNKNIISLEPKFFGIDIGDSYVKIFQLEREGKKDKIRSFACAKIKKGSTENGKIIEKEEIILSIKEALEKASPKKVSTKKVICSLPESKVFLRIINIPKIEESEAYEAIKWEMEANIPLPIDSVYFDWQFIDSETKNKQKVLTVAVHKEVVDVLSEILEKVGLEPYIFEVESIATARSLISEDENKESLDLIVDLGNTKTSFIVVENGVPCFTSGIPFSSEVISDAISKGLNINEVQTEKIKNDYGIENPLKDNPILNSVKSVLENLAKEIENTADFYSNSLQKSKSINRIILSGTGANLKGIIPYLAKRLRKEVEMGDPWTNLNLGNELPIINQEDSIKFSTAIGLALRGFYYED
jgi:type IV pilus assembly protein PilM